MISTIGKASSRTSERERLEKLRREIERRIKAAYRDFLASFDDPSVQAQIKQAVASNNIDEMIAIASSQTEILGNAVPGAFITAATAEMDHLKSILPKPRIAATTTVGAPGVTGAGGIPAAARLSVGFDPSHPRAAEKMQGARLTLIKEFNDKQADATRQALIRSFQAGSNPREVALSLRRSIGLTDRQEAAVDNYRRLLMKNDGSALSRDLRERGFDSKILRAAKDKTPLSDKEIEIMVQRYRENYLTYRAETIARTEGARIAMEARQESTRQMADKLGIHDRIVRVWNATVDHRTRDIHASMDGDEVGIEEPWTDGDGNQLMHPVDPSAPPETTVNCFHPDTLINVAGIHGAISRRYTGELIQLTIAGDINLSITPNHPVLTERGWVVARDVVEGDNVINCVISESFDGCSPYIDYRNTSAEQLYGLADISTMHRPELAVVNLHGEVPTHQVDVVAFPSKLVGTFNALGHQFFGNISLHDSDTSQPFLFGSRLYRKLMVRPYGILSSLVSLGQELRLLFCRHPSETNAVGVTPGSFFKPKINKARLYRAALHAETFRHCLNRIPGFIHARNVMVKFLSAIKAMLSDLSVFNRFDFFLRSSAQSEVIKTGSDYTIINPKMTSNLSGAKSFGMHHGNSGMISGALFTPMRVTSILRSHYDGPVYNFESDNGLIIANGIVTHNCRCTFSTRIKD